MLRTIFKAQLGAKNAAAGSSSTGLFATELTVDEVTNSLIITAPPPLAERLADFARSLDDSAAENAREISIISLKKTNAARVQKILDLLMEDGSRGRAPPTVTGHSKSQDPVGRPRTRRARREQRKGNHRSCSRYGAETPLALGGEEDDGCCSAEGFASPDDFPFSGDVLLKRSTSSGVMTPSPF